MNYELVKKLKESGMQWENVSHFDMKGNEIQAENYPTLSELIEACGEDFNCLFKHPEIEPKNWIAGYMVGTWEGVDWARDDVRKKGIGLTPYEALANLWLKINNK